MSDPYRTLRDLVLAAALMAITACGPTATTSPVVHDAVAPPQHMTQQNREGLLPEDPPLADIPAFDDDAVVIALLLPLSGDAAAVGNMLLDAATLAFFDAYDPRLQLRPFDTRGTAAGAAFAAEAALDARAAIIIGPLFSASVRAAGDVARAARIPLIGFSNDKTIAGGGTYVMGFMPDQEVRRVISYAARQGYRRFAGLIPDNPYGDRVLDAFGRSLIEARVQMAAIEIYPRLAAEVFDPVKRLADYDRRRAAYLQEEAFLKGLDDDLAAIELKKLRSLETIGDVSFDAVLVPEGDPLIRSLGPLLPFYEVDPLVIKFLGTGLWDNASLVKEPPLIGGWYAAPDPALAGRFFERFKSTFGRPAPRIASLGYDALAIAARLARFELRRERFSRRQIENLNGFTGVDGPLRFTADGVAERRFAIVEITPNGMVAIDPAPHGFLN